MQPGEFKNYVAGRFVASDTLFDDINPVDGSLVARVHEAGRETVDAAVDAARDALSGHWGAMAPAERAALLNKVADGIDARFDEFVAAEIADTGKPVVQARALDIPRGAANLRFFANLVTTAGGECFDMATADGRGALNYTVQKPLGVVGVISPWNLPLLLMTWKLGPALAAGNTVIAKPSEETPGTAFLLAEVMHDAGVPEGVFNLVNGFGPGSAGEFITSHRGIDAITFTGESATGSAIMRAAADNVKALSFVIRTRRQERRNRIRGHRLRAGGRRHCALGLLELRPGLPLLGADLRPRIAVRGVRREARGACRGAASRLAAGRADRNRAAGFEEPPGESSFVLPARSRGRRRHRHGRRCPGIR
jgi:hypothetical protein